MLTNYWKDIFHNPRSHLLISSIFQNIFKRLSSAEKAYQFIIHKSAIFDPEPDQSPRMLTYTSLQSIC